MSNRPAVYFILLVVMIDAIGIGLIMPVMPALLLDLGGSTLANAAIWGGILDILAKMHLNPACLKPLSA